ncbi:hypothetical protein BCR34DRAFT_189118 [Clohesyomyces aquaticus]|uniref:Uncharacterized protein n=1 Tax=Clohesyomyces aquaticus TaxID=1231657 RepID=A0A1Y1ZY18_9PLEO|nr:hypothetical protein BCR34DRAFT_189118 [Clohesyomyces aquaticus]
MDMQARAHSPSRWLAIALSSLTIVTHTLLVVFALHIHNAAGSLESGASWFVVYNAVAAGAGILGVMGALKMNRSHISAYAVMQATTLLLSTFALLDLVLPFEITAIVPLLPIPRIDSNAICREVDDSFGWDAQWADRCLMSFMVMRAVAAGVGYILLAVQWCALIAVWRWGRGLCAEERRGDGECNFGDVESTGGKWKEVFTKEALREVYLVENKGNKV